MTRSLCQPTTAEAQGQLVAQGGRVRTTRGEGGNRGQATTGRRGASDRCGDAAAEETRAR